MAAKSGELTMLGKRPPQSNLFAADSQYLKFVGEDPP